MVRLERKCLFSDNLLGSTTLSHVDLKRLIQKGVWCNLIYRILSFFAGFVVFREDAWRISSQVDLPTHITNRNTPLIIEVVSPGLNCRPDISVAFSHYRKH